MKRRIAYGVLILSILILCISACSNEPKPDIALAEFPGLRWNSTPEEVKEALKLKEDQILADRLLEYEADDHIPEYEEWNISVTGLTYFGGEVVGANFKFIRYPGKNFGLVHVDLYFAKDTDMTEIKNHIAEIYGEGSDEPAPHYSYEDGALVTSKQNVTRTDDGLPHYWYSTVTGTELLSAEAQERYVDYVINSDLNPSREAALERLEKEPIASIACGSRNTMGTLNEKAENPSPYITQNIVSFDARIMVHFLQLFER